ncbi:hypothetical protein HPG69_017974 [Diceros bicornis minor]|uniref:Uncharacterized protein n=1 Tax=Diceros bicornis minor TaxID=77932 RepID=A0A7J7F3M8_DICBM|nr:hypothetical protein HPG69_017974 [Diceros bicornis minor]
MTLTATSVSIHHSKPRSQHTDGFYSNGRSGESEEGTKVKEKAMDCASLLKGKQPNPRRKQLGSLRKRMNIQANMELTCWVIFSWVVFGEEHWKCVQALANLIYGCLTLRGLPAQAKKHAESTRNTLLTWKGDMTTDKGKKEILEALAMIYHTRDGWLLQNHGREAYFNLQKAEGNVKGPKEL